MRPCDLKIVVPEMGKCSTVTLCSAETYRKWHTLILDVLEEGVLSGGRGSGRDVCRVAAPSLTSPLELDDEGVPRDSRAADGDVGAGLDDDVVHQLGGQRDDVGLLRGS